MIVFKFGFLAGKICHLLRHLPSLAKKGEVCCVLCAFISFFVCVGAEGGTLQGSAAVFVSVCVCVCGNHCKPASCYCNKTSQFPLVSQASLSLTNSPPTA